MGLVWLGSTEAPASGWPSSLALTALVAFSVVCRVRKIPPNPPTSFRGCYPRSPRGAMRFAIAFDPSSALVVVAWLKTANWKQLEVS